MRRWLLIAVAAGSGYFPLLAHAVDIVTTRARAASGVVMMVGGMGGAVESAALSVGTASNWSASGPDETNDRQSVVIQPRGPLSADLVQQATASAAARVIALSPIIDQAARAVGLDSALLMAVIEVESGGNPQAVSPKGATGLMQLMPGTGARLGASDLFDVRQNVAAGARYLKDLMRQFGDLSLALAAYNAGEGAVQKYGGQIPPYAETMTYVPKVMARYHWYRNGYRNAASSTATRFGEETPERANGRFFMVASPVRH
ncbi:lytic transglycosylase domain-containing protein [Paraburkholderia caledonica]|uniref:lytic transglycosylase domain-containing protein n=1 Tax=Paraburkholderia caledonica TaxID=134536 RepID=UPI001D0CC10D